MTDPRVIDTTAKPTDQPIIEEVGTVEPTVTSGGVSDPLPQSLAEPVVYTPSLSSYNFPKTTWSATQLPNTDTYTAILEKTDTRVVADAEAFAGLAAHEIWAVTIQENGKWFAAISAYVWRLNEQNTVPGNRYLNAKASDSIAIFDHDVKVADFTLPKKAQALLDKLNS